VTMPAGPGIGTLTSRLLMELAAGVDHYSPAEAARLSTTTLEVLATRLAHELDGDRWVPPDVQRRVLLATRPVAAIAARWGFRSAIHFSRAFRARYGLPPPRVPPDLQRGERKGQALCGTGTPPMVLRYSRGARP
jgi:AraC-like DNA-binding protein